MKHHRTYYMLGTGIKYLVVTLLVFFSFVIISDIADKAFTKNTRFNCWKLEQYAATYPAFWITHDEDVSCRSVDIIINAEVRK